MRIWPAALALLVVLAWAKPACAKIVVSNVKAGEVLRYPVVLLRGTTDGEAPVVVVNGSNERPDGRNQATPHGGHWKVLVELVPGENKLELSSQKEKLTLTLGYKPATTTYGVRAIYVTAKDGDTNYLTQKPGDPHDHVARIGTALKLMQTFTAESLNDAGFGRKTFALELDAEGQVVVHTVAYPASAADLRQKDGNALYDLLGKWLEKDFPTTRTKNVVVMGFTSYDPVAKKLLAHTALGGGGLGLFSSNGLCTWPVSLRDAERAFSDTTPVDTQRICDDSNSRSTLWGLAATTLGATLHEMGHTFGLPHVQDPESVMSRGFDHFNRFFATLEPACAEASEPYAFREDEVMHWDKESAPRLATSRWFAPDPRAFLDAPVEARPEGKAVVASSKAGIRFVLVASARKQSVKVWHEEPAPPKVRIEGGELRALVAAEADEAVTFTFGDDDGNYGAYTDYGNLRPKYLDTEFGAGYRQFHFGLSPAELSDLLPKKPPIAWESLPVADEFKTAEVRYFFLPIKDCGDLPEASVDGKAISTESYACFFFREQKLMRISLRFVNSETVADHRFVLDAFLAKRKVEPVATANGVRRAFAGKVALVCARSGAEGTFLEFTTIDEPRAEGQDW